MPLPVPNLDDLRFQRDLVDEARRRIIRYCPEWTDYNLSDPGITLIELFAWMTEMLVYRLNRVPEKNYFKFLEMMGFQLQPASSAKAEVTFYLSAPFPIAPGDDTVAIVPQGLELSTRPSEEEPEVTFTTDERLVIAAPRLVQLRREEDVNRNYVTRLGIETFYAFDRHEPHAGDMFYLGFDEALDIRGYILSLAFVCDETRAVGVRREDPPWVWECSVGDGQWQEVPPSTRRGERDTTGGLNNPEGSLVIYLPLSLRPDEVHGRTAYWVRCRLERRRDEQGMYTESPRVRSITAYALGATTWATHAQIVRGEPLGTSGGEPGQAYYLRQAPVLALRPGETVEVEERQGNEIAFRPWERVVDFATAQWYDRCFVLDEAAGEVRFGPAVRQPDGSMRQYGRVPEVGRRLRVTQYRHGGGAVGNVPVGKIQVLRSSVPYIDRVVNLSRAEGGRDQESLEELQMRARRELRAQQRAVTAEDFEHLAKGATRSVARVKCTASSGSADRREGEGTGKASRNLPPGMVELLVVPAAFDALRAADLSKLRLDEPLRDQIRAHLDRFRLLTTTLRIREPDYIGVRARVEIAASEFSAPEVVRTRVRDSLRNLLSPLAIGGQADSGEGLLGPDWEGWPFGRDLYLSEIYSHLQKVPGVKHVLEVHLSYRRVIPARETGLGDEAVEEAAKADLTSVRDRRLKVPDDTLLCSLDHQVKIVEL